MNYTARNAPLELLYSQKSSGIWSTESSLVWRERRSYGTSYPFFVWTVSHMLDTEHVTLVLHIVSCVCPCAELLFHISCTQLDQHVCACDLLGHLSGQNERYMNCMWMLHLSADVNVYADLSLTFAWTLYHIHRRYSSSLCRGNVNAGPALFSHKIVCHMRCRKTFSPHDVPDVH